MFSIDSLLDCCPKALIGFMIIRNTNKKIGQRLIFTGIEFYLLPEYLKAIFPPIQAIGMYATTMSVIVNHIGPGNI